MIIGKGDLAKALVDREGILFFASGVSNSRCNDNAEFYRELDLLYKYKGYNVCCVYFSTISIYNPVLTPYILHKATMEQAVKSYFDNYCIVRIGNIDWGENPNTFLNFLRNKIKNGEDCEIRDEYKYMISKDQFAMVTSNIPLTGKNEICVFGYKAKVKDLL